MFLYKRPAHRVIVNNVGHMMVSPSSIEASMQQSPASVYAQNGHMHKMTMVYCIFATNLPQSTPLLTTQCPFFSAGPPIWPTPYPSGFCLSKQSMFGPNWAGVHKQTCCLVLLDCSLITLDHTLSQTHLSMIMQTSNMWCQHRHEQKQC